MPVVALFDGLTRERYEQALRLLTGKARIESAADWPVDGLLAHIAGEGASGFRVIDVWESEEALARFAEALGPVLTEIGVQGGPEVYTAYTFVVA